MVSESRSVVSDSPWSSPGQNTGVGSLSLLQGIFPTQGWNPGLLHCQRILYQLSHKGSPRILEWAAYPFSSRSFPARNQTRVSGHCRWILYQLSYQGSSEIMVMNTYSMPWFLYICIWCVYEHCVHTHTMRLFFGRKKKKGICFPPSFLAHDLSLFKQMHVPPQGGLRLVKGKEVSHLLFGFKPQN